MSLERRKERRGGENEQKYSEIHKNSLWDAQGLCREASKGEKVEREACFSVSAAGC